MAAKSFEIFTVILSLLKNIEKNRGKISKY